MNKRQICKIPNKILASADFVKRDKSQGSKEDGQNNITLKRSRNPQDEK